MAGNIIQQATFRAALDPGGYEQGGDRMIRKSAEITNAVDRVSDSTTKAGRNAALSSQGFDKLLASLDPNIQRAQQYQREFDKLNRYHEAGVATAGQYSTALQLLQSKYSDLSNGAKKLSDDTDGLGIHFSRAITVMGAFAVVLGSIRSTAQLTDEQLVKFGVDEHVRDRAKAFDDAWTGAFTHIKAGIVETLDLMTRWTTASERAEFMARDTRNPIGSPSLSPVADRVLGQQQNEIIGLLGQESPFQKYLKDRNDAAKKANDEYVKDNQDMLDSIDAAWEKYRSEQVDANQKFWDEVDKARDKSFEEFQQIWREQPIQWTAGPIADERMRREKEIADEAARQQERAARESERFWDRMFDDLFQSGHVSFSKFLEDLAIEAYARPIIVPVLQQLGGSLGIGGAGLSGGAGALSGLGSLGGLGGGLGGIGSLLGLGSFGSIANGNIGAGALGFLDGTSNAAAGLGLGSLLGSIGPAAAVAYGGIQVGHMLGGKGQTSDIISALTGGLGGAFFHQDPSNYTAWANFGSDYSIANGLAGDKPNQNTISLAQQAGAAISTAAKELEAAGITLTSGVSRLEIGQRDASRLYLSSGKRVDVGAVGDVNAAVNGTLSYLLNGASASDPAIQGILNATKGQSAEQIIGAISSARGALGIGDTSGGTQGALDQLTQHIIDQLTDPAKTAWEDLLKLEQQRVDVAKQYNLDTTLLDRRSKLEQEDFIKKLSDDQRSGLAASVDLSGSVAYQQAEAARAATLAAQAAAAQAQAAAEAKAQWEQLFSDARTAAQGAISGRLSTISRTSSNQRSLAASYSSAGSSLTSTLNALSTGSLSALGPIDRYNAARAQLAAANGNALGGSIDALGSLGGLAQTFLNESRNVNASTSAYGSDFDFVQSVLGGAASSASGLGSSAQHAADVADAQVNLLQSIDTAIRSPSIDTGYLQRSTDLLQRVADGIADLAEIQQGTSDTQETLADVINQLRRLLTVDLQQAA